MATGEINLIALASFSSSRTQMGREAGQRCVGICVCYKRACAIALSGKMVDEATKKTLASIPLLRTNAGPRDGDQWATRLKEEYMSLIKVTLGISLSPFDP